MYIATRDFVVNRKKFRILLCRLPFVKRNETHSLGQNYL